MRAVRRPTTARAPLPQLPGLVQALSCVHVLRRRSVLCDGMRVQRGQRAQWGYECCCRTGVVWRIRLPSVRVFRGRDGSAQAVPLRAVRPVPHRRPRELLPLRHLRLLLHRVPQGMASCQSAVQRLLI